MLTIKSNHITCSLFKTVFTCRKSKRIIEKGDKIVRYHKPKSLKPIPMKRLKCSQCNKTFSFKKSWIRHMIFEHKFLKDEIWQKQLLPLYHCDICEETFSKRSLLVNHKILVHKENRKDIEKYTEITTIR